MDFFISFLLALLVFVHILICLGIIAGGLLAITGRFRRYPKHRRNFLIGGLLVAASYIFTGACIVTTLEKFLRQEYFPQTIYTEGFMTHYLAYIGIHITDHIAFGIIATFLGIVFIEALIYWIEKQRRLV